MTGEEIRDLGYLKWRDSWAWMERMKGKRWENLIKIEKEHFNELAKQPSVEREARQMEKEIVDTEQYSKLPGFKIGCGTIDIILIPNYKFVWKWVWSKQAKPAVDIDVLGNIVWYVTSDEDKDNTNKLICESSDGKVIWTKKAVSSNIAIIGELCYYINVIDYFRTVELCVCNAHSGSDNRVIYRETDKTRDIYKAASPVFQVDQEAPRHLLIHGAGDELVSVYHTRTLAERLKKLGRPAEVEELRWATHGFDYFHQSPSSVFVRKRILRFLEAD